MNNNNISNLINNLTLLDDTDFQDELDDWEQQKILIEQQFNTNNINVDTPIPTELFISTISANCRTIPIKYNNKIAINIKVLIKYLIEQPFKELIYIKDSKNISRKNQTNGCGNHIFYNQITMDINPYYDPNNNINYINCIKIKLFQNGVIGISGMKDIYSNDGKRIVNIIIDYIKSLPNNIYYIIPFYEMDKYQNIVIEYIKHKILHNSNINNNNISLKCVNNITNIIINYVKDSNKIINNKFDISLLNIYDFKNSLINSDFSFINTFCIDRNKLYNMLLNEGYFVIYKNDSYPAVKLCYYYNESYELNNGICKCNIKCNGKGDGLVNGDCKCITIPIFQSGAVLIFGKCEPKHVFYIYNFITNYLITHYPKIRQISFKPNKIKKKIITLEIKSTEFDNIQKFKEYISQQF